MKTPFKTVGLIGKPHHKETQATLKKLFQWLRKHKVPTLLEQRVAQETKIKAEAYDINELAQHIDLAIVIGGDGNMLGAARVLSRYNVGVLGINRGNLGFLTDVLPDDFERPLKEILQGNFKREKRFLLETNISHHGQLKSTSAAMNETVIHAGKVAHMMEFEVYIDDEFMYSQRADGLIVSTPTGSTAYALSAGGTIVSPTMNAIMLIPMFPHTLAARPILIDGHSTVKVITAPDPHSQQQVSCDGQIDLPIVSGDEITISQSPHQLQLIHPENYQYFEALRSKLGWGNQLF